MKSNICVIGLLSKYTKNISSKIAIKLDMFFADIISLLEFDIIDIDKTIEICGKEYYEKLLFKKVKEVSSFNNTLIYLDYYLLNDEKYIKTIKDNCLVLYLNLSKENFEKKLDKEKYSDLSKILNLGTYDDRHKICKEVSDIIIDCNDITASKIISEVKNKLLEYFDTF